MAPASTSRGSTRPMLVLWIERLLHSFRDVPLEVVDLRFLGAESAAFPGARAGAFLGSFTDGPILAIDQIPKVHRVAGVEVWLFHHVRIEVPIALDRRVRRTSWPEAVDHEVVRVQTEEHVGEHEIVVDTTTVVLRHPSERGPLRVSGPNHRRVVLGKLHKAPVEVGSSRFPRQVCRVRPGGVVRDPVEFRMDRSAMVAFGIVLPEDLPIGLDLVGLSGSEAQVFECESPKPGEELPHLFGEVGRTVVKIRPDESAPCSGSKRTEAVILFAEIHERFRVGRTNQFSLDAVGPGVVRANQGSELFSIGHADNARPSVTANVVKSADVSIVSSNEEEGLVSNFPNEKVPGIRDLVRATDVQPTPEIEPLEFFLEYRLVPEGSPGQEGRC